MALCGCSFGCLAIRCRVSSVKKNEEEKEGGGRGGGGDVI